MTFLNPWALTLLPIISIPFLLKSSQGQIYSWLQIVPEDKVSNILELIVKIIICIYLEFINFLPKLFIHFNLLLAIIYCYLYISLLVYNI